MKSGRIGLVILGTLAAGTGAMAQTTPAPMQPGGSAVPSVIAPTRTAPAADAPRTAALPIVDAASLQAGSNSFTEGQARARLEEAGFTGIQGLTKNDAGFWRGRGMRNGSSTDVAMDFQGRIAAGPGVASLGSGARTEAPMGGTPSNPPGTAAGRAMDRATGTPPAGTTPPTR